MKKLVVVFAVCLGIGCAPEPADKRNNGPLLSIEVSPTNPTLETGVITQLTATAIFQNGFKENVTDKAIWASSDTAVASIDVDGALNPLIAGTTQVTASYLSLTSVPEIITVFDSSGTVTPTPGVCDTGVNVLITEVGYDTPTTEANTEYVEVANLSGGTVDISGYVLTDGEATFTFPGATSLTNGAFIFVARGAAADFMTDFTNFDVQYAGLTPDFDSSGLSLANGGDEMELRDCQDALVDVVAWGSAPNPPAGWTCGGANPTSGTDAALARDSLSTDTDDCTDWTGVAFNPGEATP